MKLTIDNLDGLGAVDYSSVIDRSQKVSIVRERGVVAVVNGSLCLVGTALAMPMRRARLVLTSEAGMELFRGYLATAPVPVYAGVASEGSVYRLAFHAAADQPSLNSQTATFAVGATHTLADGDGTLHVSPGHATQLRELASDVTLSGELEPTTYWTEVFEGDGTTLEFDLTGEPAGLTLGHAALLADDFQAAAIDPERWAVVDPGVHLLLGAGGLVLNGGNGFDGQTTLVAKTPVEMGGTLVLELRDVMLNAGSAGVLGGFYGGTGAVVGALANCMAGFNVRQSGGNTIVTAMVDGVEVGQSATLTPGRRYTLRLHLHCAELLRTAQSFAAIVDAGGGLQLQQFGGGAVAAPLAVVFAIRDQGQSSNTAVTVLYDGAMASSFAEASFCLANSVQLFGSVGSVSLARSGTAWVRSTGSNGTPFTRLAGLPNTGVDCTVQASVTGKVTFYAGREPAVGEYVTVLYREQSRAVGRLADAAALAAEIAGGASGTTRFLGKVEHPRARTSADCENAAQALLAASTARAAAVAGSFITVNPPLTADVFPGDVLALPAIGVNGLIRQVTIEENGAAPEAVTYRIAFANGWPESLGMTLSESIAADAVRPQTPLELAPGQTPASPARALANLEQMTVIGFTGSGSSSGITVDAGTDPPPGGGFEVRRSNSSFGKGTGAGVAGDLVLQSPVRGFTIPRAQTEETFYVRMFDGSSPRLYSRFASAIATHVPFE